MMIMFKRLFPILLTLCFFIGCSSGHDTPATTVDIQPDAAAQTILEQVPFRDTLVKAEGGAEENLYRLDDSIADYAIYVSGSGATAEEVAVLKLAEGATADDAREIIENRIEKLTVSFQDYVPGELVKLQDPVIAEQGNAVILVLSDDNDAAQAAIDGLAA